MNAPAEVCETCSNQIDWEARRKFADRIASLLPGDFFHARGMTRGGGIFLTTAVSESTISASELASPSFISRFDRSTGQQIPDEGAQTEDAYLIDCVEPLPITVHLRLLDIERRNRLRPMQNVLPGFRPNLKAFHRAHEHYRAHAFHEAAVEDQTK